MSGKDGQSVRAKFGETNRADGIPDCPARNEGPVYLEGKLVLSLSFRGSAAEPRLTAEGEDPLERYRLWDDLSETWYDDGLVLLRFEQADRIVRSRPLPIVLWEGAVDTRARVVPVPDLDETGMAANRGCDLRWKRV